MMKLSIKRLAVIALSACLALPALSLAADDISSINKAIRVDSGAAVGDVQSVNGSIRIDNDAVVRSIESVNGTIRVGEGVKVEKDIEAVNGTIKLASATEVGGDVETVNGKIQLEQSTIAGNVGTYNGGIALLNGTVVEGDVTVSKPFGWSSKPRKPVQVEIGENVRVYGDLVFEQPVELIIHDSAEVGEVIGNEVTVIDG